MIRYEDKRMLIIGSLTTTGLFLFEDETQEAFTRNEFVTGTKTMPDVDLERTIFETTRERGAVLPPKGSVKRETLRNKLRALCGIDISAQENDVPSINC